MDCFTYMGWNERNFLKGRVRELGHTLGRTREMLFSGDGEVFGEDKLDEVLAEPRSLGDNLMQRLRIEAMVKANLKEYRKRMKRA